MEFEATNETHQAAVPSSLKDQILNWIATDAFAEGSDRLRNDLNTVLVRPSLSRFSTAESISSKDRLYLTQVATNESAFSEGTANIRKLDRALEKELKNETSQCSTDATTIKTGNSSPYHNWECGFGFTVDHEDLDEIPATKADFLAAVKGELKTIEFIQNGLTSYNEAINSGVHHAFTHDFLKQQTDATHKTVGQLFHISKNLQDIVNEVEAVKSDFDEVDTELKEAFAHAQPWIKRTRAVLVSSHVFYKINYVLGSDRSKHIH